jgi:hypothetical protein
MSAMTQNQNQNQTKPNHMETTKDQKARLTRLHRELQKEIADYMKAKRGELRKRPVYLKKDSDKCVDKMSETFRYFVNSTYRN